MPMHQDLLPPLLFILLPDVKADYVHQDESHDEVDNLGDYFDENL